MKRRLGITLAVIVGALLALWAVLRTPDIDAEKLRAKYTSPASEFVEVELGLKLHVRDEGPKDAPTIILIHGSSASLQTWEPWVQRLSDSYRVISYDQAGHGLTGPHPRDCYSADCFVSTLEALRKAKQIDRFIVAGNSMGGWVAWNYALAHPEHLDGMILVDAAGTPVKPAKLPIGFRLTLTPVVRDIVRDITPRSIIEQSLKSIVADPSTVNDRQVDTYWELLRYPRNRRATGQRFAADRTVATPAVLAKIKTPSLIMWGAKDTLIPVAAAKLFAKGLPNDRSVDYDDLGHIPQEEDPDRSAADARAFVASLSSPD